MCSRPLAGVNSIHQLRGEMDRLFENLVESVSPWAGMLRAEGGAFPALNVWEDDESLYAEAELPGLRMEDLEVSVRGNELTIKGERNNSRDQEGTYHRRERGAGAFGRVVRLPVEINAERVEASLQAGVLTVKMPKAEAAKPRRIEVKS